MFRTKAIDEHCCEQVIIMTELQIIQNGKVQRILAGLADSEEVGLVSGLRRTYIARCMEHVIKFLKDKATEDGVIGLNISTQYPKFPLGKNKPVETTLHLPYIVVAYRGGVMKEIGVGRKRAETVDGPAFAFWQFANIEFDCFSKSQEECDLLAGWVSESIQQEKLNILMQKGFINWKQIYSRSGFGFQLTVPWDYPKYYTYPFEVFRHILYMETSFEVVWVKREETAGIINQIIFNEENEYFPDFAIGFGLEFLLAEDLYHQWHNVFV